MSLLLTESISESVTNIINIGGLRNINYKINRVSIVGIMNFSQINNGLQLSLIENYAGTFKSLQIGLVNNARNLNLFKTWRSKFIWKSFELL